jgi:hypothetical protein
MLHCMLVVCVFSWSCLGGLFSRRATELLTKTGSAVVGQLHMGLLCMGQWASCVPSWGISCAVLPTYVQFVYVLEQQIMDRRGEGSLDFLGHKAVPILCLTDGIWRQQTGYAISKHAVQCPSCDHMGDACP